MTQPAPKVAREATPPLPVMRRSRELAVQLLYQVDLNGTGPTPELLADFFTQAQEVEPFKTMKPRDYAKLQRLASEMVREVWRQHAQLDELLTKHSANWTLTRMAAVDRNILRLALWELRERDEIPSAVTINEAVELAKTFGDQESWRFVNGLLDFIRKELGIGTKDPVGAAAEAPSPATEAASTAGKADAEPAGGEFSPPPASASDDAPAASDENDEKRPEVSP